MVDGIIPSVDLRELQRRARDIGFLPRDAVRWLSPAELARAGVKAVLATIFADYADKRELQAVLPSTLLWAPRESIADGGVWLDFVADLGDGFEATSTVASYLAEPTLMVRAPDGTTDPPTALPRGSLLVMGGDEVYPTASARDYEDRTTGPYAAALPEAEDSPQLVALPGNHDWYDGLTSFLRIFTQGGRVGGWQLTQTRSYFAVQLPSRWWLVAVDSQLGTYIDKPQLDYFERHVTQNLQPGDGIIVCSAVPTWVHTATGSPDAFDTLHWFERTHLRQRRVVGSDSTEPIGASVRLWITGDSHHYVRYAEELAPGTDESPAADKHRRQMVTCGLGGAFLSSTGRLPKSLVIPPAESRLRDRDPGARFVEGPATYPARAVSRALSRRLAMPWRVEWLPRRNPGFAQLAASVHAALFLLLAALLGASSGSRAVTALRTADVSMWTRFALELGLGVGILLLLPWLWRLVRHRADAETPSTVVAGVAFQLGCALLILAVCAAVPWPGGWADWAVLGLCLVIAAGLGAVLGSEAFALFVLTAHSGQVYSWQMAGASVEDHKGFVRMNITDQGDLVLYPVLIDAVCRDWRVADERRDAGGGAVGKRPVPATDLPPPRLAEPPIVIAREGPTPVPTAAHDHGGSGV